MLINILSVIEAQAIVRREWKATALQQLGKAF